VRVIGKHLPNVSNQDRESPFDDGVFDLGRMLCREIGRLRSVRSVAVSSHVSGKSTLSLLTVQENSH
jgi:hypothetical protein